MCVAGFAPSTERGHVSAPLCSRERARSRMGHGQLLVCRGIWNLDLVSVHRFGAGPKTAATSRKPLVFPVMASTIKQRTNVRNRFENPMMVRVRGSNKRSVVIGAPFAAGNKCSPHAAAEQKFAEGWPGAPISLRKGPFYSHLEQFWSRAYHAAQPPRKATDK